MIAFIILVLTSQMETRLYKGCTAHCFSSEPEFHSVTTSANLIKSWELIYVYACIIYRTMLSNMSQPLSVIYEPLPLLLTKMNESNSAHILHQLV